MRRTYGESPRTFVGLCFLAMLFSSAHAAEEYWITVSVSRFDCSSVKPGDTVIIAAGTRGPLNIRNCLGSKDAPITIRNDSSSNSPVIIRRESGAVGNFLFVIANSRYIVVDGTRGWRGMPSGAYCGAPSGRDGCGIQIMSVAPGDSPTSYYMITGENIRDQVHKGIMVDGRGSYENVAEARIGILLNDHSQPADGPLRENIVITRNYVTTVWGEGMYIGPNPYYNTTPLGNVEVSYNLVEKTGRDAIEVKSVYRGVARILGNHALAVGRRSDREGQHNGLTVGGNSMFEGNYVQDAGEAGIRAIAWEETPGSGPFTTEIFNNVVVRSGRSGPLAGHGISVSAQEGFEVRSRIHHNTTVENSHRGINVYSTAGPGEVWNNISVGNQAGDIVVGTSGSKVWNNHTGGVNSAGFQDPQNMDYRLSNASPAIDAASGGSPSTDFLGNRRPQGTASDLGAFEFLGVSNAPNPPTIHLH